MNSYQEFKTFYSSNVILFIALLFVIVYIVINWEQIYNGNYFSGQMVKPILVTGIIFLVAHMLITWDDNSIETEYPSDIPKYKLGNPDDFDGRINVNPTYQPVLPGQSVPQLPYQTIQPVQPVQPVQSNQLNQFNQLNQPTQLESKYKISNRFDNYQKPSNPLENILLKNNFANQSVGNKMSEQGIFISHKNSARYGLKFN